MAERDCPASDIDALIGEIERLHESQNNSRKGLIDLEQVNVGNVHSGAGKHLLRHVNRTGQHQRGFRSDVGEGADFRAWLPATAFARLGIAN